MIQIVNLPKAVPLQESPAVPPQLPSFDVVGTGTKVEDVEVEDNQPELVETEVMGSGVPPSRMLDISTSGKSSGIAQTHFPGHSKLFHQRILHSWPQAKDSN